MTVRYKLAAAAIVVVLATLGVLRTLLPSSWSEAVTASAIAVALSLGALVYLPAGFTRASRSTAARLAGLGPLGATLAVTLLASIVALATSTTGHPGLAWALLIVALAVFVIGVLLTSATGNVVDDAQTRQRKDDRYGQWTRSLASAAHAIGDAALKARCDKIAEALRYAPSTRSEDASNEASLVSAAVAALQASADQGDISEIAARIDHLQRVLAEHAATVTALRSQA
ncbi:hypothetical protein PTE30175_01474 [Pandoraea terrae]|uniref:Uncharacterized protein n=1 Tax=Pandoraea terrae TaxID=1537710 RepID=A0A5E4TSC3_9BURK|nr:hypothetical protein [Pandoraea terrae]VVD89504.1 hypothetical protein PTE30175_01474 [Pandoraea terrae]